MSRVEENENMKNYMESVLKSGDMTYEQMMSQQLGAVCFLIFPKASL